MGNGVITKKCKAPFSLATVLRGKLWSALGHGVTRLLFESLIFTYKGQSLVVAYLNSNISLFLCATHMTICFEPKDEKTFRLLLCTSPASHNITCACVCA